MFRTTFVSDKKQWSGVKTQTIFNPYTSIGNVILNVLKLNASRTAQVNDSIVEIFHKSGSMSLISYER